MKRQKLEREFRKYRASRRRNIQRGATDKKISRLNPPIGEDEGVGVKDSKRLFKCAAEERYISRLCDAYERFDVQAKELEKKKDYKDAMEEQQERLSHWCRVSFRRRKESYRNRNQ